MSAEKEGGIMPETRYVVGPNNETVNLRKKPEGALIDRIRSGDIAEILTEGAVWSKVRVNGRTGYMMTKFLQDTIEEIVPINPDEIGKEDFEDHDTDELLDLLEETYSALRDLCERIEHAIAKG